ncbi:uncharacterized protein LOC124410073 [Diprion similis]|uniref:uncharacterized protein LOC124410073 n=1 Tax=Diprion similis TaxID=362088 RepID=UPI001EF87EB8|nr:uncharacterized protein LOC124410073 [Diprion similis]
MNSLASSSVDIIPEACTCSVCKYEIDLRKPSTYQSDVTIFPRPSCSCHPDDCACCYCLPCKGKNEDLPMSDRNEHPITCNCCKCGAQDVEYASSSISTKSNELHDYPDGIDHLQKIALILERVDSEMQEHILRWINMSEDTLNSDLAALDVKRGKIHEEQEASVCDVQSLVSKSMPTSTFETMCFGNDEDSCCND